MPAAALLFLCLNVRAAEPPAAGHAVVETTFAKAEKLVQQRRWLEARETLKPELDKGDRELETLMGQTFFLSSGSLRNVSEARRWYRSAALKGQPLAQFTLWTLFTTEKGSLNADEALKWLQAAAESGQTEAQLELGKYYWQPMLAGGAPNPHCDPDRAIAWLERATRTQGPYDSQSREVYTQLAEMASEPSELPAAAGPGRKALEALERGAESGDAWAQYELMSVYDPDEKGPYKDLKRAYLWGLIVSKNEDQADDGAELVGRLGPALLAEDRERLQRQARRLRTRYKSLQSR